MAPASKRKRKASTSTGTSRTCNKKPRQTLDSFFSAPIAVVKASEDSESHSVSHVALSAEQTRVLRMVVDQEQNVFFTGAAGTGKSLLLRAIITGLRKKYAKHPEAVAITASTAMAASNIGGQTIHAWGAVAPTVDDMDNLIKCIKTCRPAHQRWKQAKVLIIDEVSMVDGYLFNRLAQIATRLRKKTTKPFGGLQIVVTGDFFQLPPVTKGSIEPYFAFESSAWKNTLDCTVNLVKVYRQRDQRLVDALNSLRHGEPSHDAADLFTSLSKPLAPLFIEPTASQQATVTPTQALTQARRRMTEILPTELFPHRHAVAKANRERLDCLPAQLWTYTSTDTGEKLHALENMLAEPTVDLKLGAQVMLIKNVDDVLVNGLIGKVIGFFRSWELVSTAIPTRKPLSSISAGAKPKDSKKNAALLRHVGLNDEGKPVLVSDIKADPENQAVDRKPTKRDDERFPLVLFQYSVPGSTGDLQTEAVLLKRDEFTVEDTEGKVLARRVQIPLILAWAMSIHKSQGQTLHRLKVDLTKVFERGQSYVALSRASSIEGLQVVGFNRKKVMAHQKVIEWNKSLETVGAA